MLISSLIEANRYKQGSIMQKAASFTEMHNKTSGKHIKPTKPHRGSVVYYHVYWKQCTVGTD